MEKEYEVTTEGLKETVQVTNTFTLEQCDNQIELAEENKSELQIEIADIDANIAMWQDRKDRMK